MPLPLPARAPLTRRLLATAGLALLGLAASAPSALAQQAPAAYPSGPVQMVVPFPAGGPADVVGRAIAEQLSAALGQNVLVLNQPGAGGNLGGKAVAQARPDGHTLLFTVDATLTANPSVYGARMGYVPSKDLQPVTTAVSFGSTLAVHPGLGVQRLDQFLQAARARPLSYASAGNASTGHLTMALFGNLAGLQLTHIPYKGAAPALTDMVGGQVDAGFLVTPGVVPHVRSGRLVALAVSGEQRSPLLPDVPTMAEAGFPGATLPFGMVLLAPAGTPQAIVRRLHEETRRALASDGLRELARANDYAIVADTPEQAAARLAATTARLDALIRSAGISAD